MKKNLMMALVAMIAVVNVSAQNIPAGMRMEIGDSERDKSEYSLFSYKDEDGTFGYYLSLGRVTKILGAIRDDITDMSFDDIRETSLYLGATTDEAFATFDNILALYDKDLGTSVEFQGRAITGSGRLGEPTTSLCVVRKNVIGSKRLQFIFTSGKRQVETYLPKSVVKDLRTDLKIDKKLHPKQHR